MSIRFRLLMTLTAFITILILSGALQYAQLRGIKSINDNFEQDMIPSLVDLGTIRRCVLEIASTVESLYRHGHEKESVAEARRTVQDLREQMSAAQKRLEALMIEPEERSNWSQFQKGFNDLKEANDLLLQDFETLQKSGQFSPLPESVRLHFKARDQAKAQSTEILTKLVRFNAKEARERATSAVSKTESAVNITILSICVGILAAGSLGWLLFIAIVRPINRIKSAAETIAQGKLDTDSLPKLDSFQGEFRDLQKSLLAMTSSLINAIKQADEVAQQAKQAQAQAAQAASEAQQAKLDAETAKRDGELAAAERLTDVVSSMTSSAEELRAQIDTANQGSQQQMARVGETSAAMDQMNATVLDVARNAADAATVAENVRGKAGEGSQLVGSVVRAMDELAHQAQGLSTNMDDLGLKAQAIGAVVGVISDIADQTNLLALNAAIEAARAGDAGRGFAVVADEVRKLAEKTMSATKEVGEAVRAIQSGAGSSVTAVGQAVENIGLAADLARSSGQALEHIVSLSETSFDQIRTIAAAAEQQSATSEEINRSLEDVSRLSSETSNAMGESGRAVTEVADQAEALSALIADMRGDAPAAGRRKAKILPR